MMYARNLESYERIINRLKVGGFLECLRQWQAEESDKRWKARCKSMANCLTIMMDQEYGLENKYGQIAHSLAVERNISLKSQVRVQQLEEENFRLQKEVDELKRSINKWMN